MKIKIESFRDGGKKGSKFKINSVCWKHDDGFYYVFVDFSEPKYFEIATECSGSDGHRGFWLSPLVWKNKDFVADETNFISIDLIPNNKTEKRQFRSVHTFTTLSKGTIEIILVPYSKLKAVHKTMYYSSKNFHKETTTWENKSWKKVNCKW